MKKAYSLALLLLLSSAPVACGREDGPMENAGEKIDEAVDKIANPNEGPLEEAGRKIDEAADDVKDKVD